MNVLVAAVGQADCPAARALLTEGMACEVVVMDDGVGYGQALAEMWRRGEEFCVLEHDVVPWPGAMEAIAGCEQPWCVYPYPFAPGTMRAALGCLRVSEWLVRSDLDLPEVWEGVAWNQLDAAVYRGLAAASGEREPHLHLPAFAHVKAHDALVAA